MSVLRRLLHALAHTFGVNRAFAHYRHIDGQPVGGWSCLDCERFEVWPAPEGE